MYVSDKVMNLSFAVPSLQKKTFSAVLLTLSDTVFHNLCGICSGPGLDINEQKNAPRYIPNTRKLKDKWIFMNMILKARALKEHTDKLDSIKI